MRCARLAHAKKNCASQIYLFCLFPVEHFHYENTRPRIEVRKMNDRMLYERLPRDKSTDYERFRIADRVEAEIVQFWLKGLTSREIANAVGVTISRVNQILGPERKLLAEGSYATQLAEFAAKGFTRLPTTEDGGRGKAGRPTRPLTPAEVAMRGEFVAGGRISEIARKHDISPQLVDYILRKSPSVKAEREKRSASSDE
jgi:DNA-binding CsgD family transcriptional regulator